MTFNTLPGISPEWTKEHFCEFIYSLLIFFCLFAEDIEDSDLKDTSCLSPLQPSPVLQLPSSSPPTSLNLHQSFKNNTVTTPPLYEAVFGQTKFLSPQLVQGVHSNSDNPLSSSRCTNPAENIQPDTTMAAGLNPSDQAHPSLALPSATWSSCPSPQRSTLHSGSGAKLTPSSAVSRLESQRWPILPPISPVRGEKWALLATYRQFTAFSLPTGYPPVHFLRSLIVLDMAGHPNRDKEIRPDREIKACLHSEALRCSCPH